MAKDILQTKVDKLKLSDAALERLTLSGIDILDDFNTFNLNEIKILMQDSFDEIAKVLKKYNLPNNINNLNLDDEIVSKLKSARIDSLEGLFNYDRRTLYTIFSDDEVLLNELNELFSAYDVEILEPFVEGQAAYYEEADEESALDMDLTSRIKKEVAPIMKGYGSRSYSHFKIRLASPNEIRQWSYGEVKNHETINYRTSKPEVGGLFCEQIFGPMKDFNVLVVKTNWKQRPNLSKMWNWNYSPKVRKKRMGHIDLEAPVVHTWYLKSSPSKLAILLGIKAKELESVVYRASYIVTDPGNTPLAKKTILSVEENRANHEKYPRQFVSQTGAEAVKTLLQDLDLDKEVQILRRKIKARSAQKRERAIRRLAVVEAFNNSDNKPEWMVMDVIPVIPPDLRPMVALDGGRFATTDLNDLYRRILNRNNRFKKLKEQNAPHLILQNEARMLQESVDALFDNSKRGRKAVVERGRNLKSLSICYAETR